MLLQPVGIKSGPKMYIFINCDLQLSRDFLCLQVGKIVSHLVRFLVTDSHPARKNTFNDWIARGEDIIFVNSNEKQMLENVEAWGSPRNYSIFAVLRDFSNVEVPSGSITVGAFTPLYFHELPNCFWESIPCVENVKVLKKYN